MDKLTYFHFLNLMNQRKSNSLTLVPFSGGAKSTSVSLDSGELGDSAGTSVFGA